LEDLEDGRIVLKCIFSSDGKDVEWINLAQYKNKWRKFVKAIINLRVQ